jgi:hypothetical protein
MGSICRIMLCAVCVYTGERNEAGAGKTKDFPACFKYNVAGAAALCNCVSRCALHHANRTRPAGRAPGRVRWA